MCHQLLLPGLNEGFYIQSLRSSQAPSKHSIEIGPVIWRLIALRVLKKKIRNIAKTEAGIIK